MLTLSAAFPAYAATAEKKSAIFHISIADLDAGFDNDDHEIDEDDIDSYITLKNKEDWYDIDEIKFEGSSTWKQGQDKTVKITIEVSDSDTVVFKSAKAKVEEGTKWTSTKSPSVSGGRTKKTVTLKLKGLVTDLDDPSDLSWSGNTARWEKVSGAERYRVKVYCNSKLMGSMTTVNNYADLYPAMTRAGDYYFTVRAENKSSKVESDYTDSEEKSISNYERYTGSGTLQDVLGSGQQNNQSNYNGPSNSSVQNGWAQDGRGWRYFENGNALRNSWKFVDNNWFWLAADTYMSTGWIYDGTHWYYLNPVSDGTKGRMMTGWIHNTSTNKWYYLNPNHGGPMGSMVAGYATINGKRYYFDPSSGEMWANRTLPNGAYVGAGGNY